MAKKFKTLSSLSSLLENATVPPDAKNVVLEYPESFLNFIGSEATNKVIDMNEFNMLQPWCLVALAALTKSKDSAICVSESRGGYISNAARFANGLGLYDAIFNRNQTRAEEGRTVKIQKINNFNTYEATSDGISRLITDNDFSEEFLDKEETRQTIYYILIELLRNAIQHSKDPNGGIVVAQNMNPMNKYPTHNCVQIAIADSGIGIMESLLGTRPEIDNPQIALKNAIRPFYSGAFKAHEKGSAVNAGLGLFMISEIARENCGRLFIASRGASMMMAPVNEDEYDITFPKCSYPGTLVVIELSKSTIFEHKEMLVRLREKARIISERVATNPFIEFNNDITDGFSFLVRLVTENTASAAEYTHDRILPKISSSKMPIIYDFIGLELCTQSFLHALLFLPIQEAKRNGVKIYAKNCNPQVTAAIKWVDEYLGYDEIQSE